MPQDIKDILVGILLGDAHIRRRSPTCNSNLIFAQTAVKHKEYFYYVYGFFKPFCIKDYSPLLNMNLNKKTNKVYSSLSFSTMQLPCFNIYHEMFYISKIKIVPHNIYDLLTPKGLAFWIMLVLSIFVFFLPNYLGDSLNCLAFMPITSYNDALSNKNKAITENEGKSGIYQWTHLDSNKSYVGSSVNLGRRLRNYFNTTFISHTTRKLMVINKALLKYGYSKFKLEILEYCTPKDLAKREQYYMNQISPKYNILKTAYSSLGYKHTEEALKKVQSNLQKLNLSKSIKVKVTNLETNLSVEFVSLREAAKSLNTNKTTLKKYIVQSKLFKDIYKLESDLSVSNYDSNYLNHPNSIKIEVIDLELNTVTNYASIRAASRVLDINHNTIRKYFERNQKSPYKGRYIFKKVM